MEFTFNTPVLWDFLGDSDDGGIDLRSENCFVHQRDSRRDTKEYQREIQLIDFHCII